MIQLSTLMWWMAVFFGILGFLRGWRKELVSTAGIVLAVFAAFRFDVILRGAFLFSLPPSQIFLVQCGFLIAIVFFVYQTKNVGGAAARKDDDWQAGVLGALLGAFNGYLIGGSFWYFLDINEYPLEQFFSAPLANSPAAQAIGSMPLVLASFGASGSGDLLGLGVLALLFFALVVA